MATVQAAGAAKNRNAQVARRASQRRMTVERASGTRMEYASQRERPVASRPRNSPRRSSGGRRASSAPSQVFRPVSGGKDMGNATGALEAEFIGAIALLFLTLFTDTTSSYSDKMLAVMKRGTLIALTFFILALVSAQGPNSARAAKAFGALLDVGILLSVASTDMITEIDGFFKGTWKATDSSGASSSGAPAGQGGLGTAAGGAAGIAGGIAKGIGGTAQGSIDRTAVGAPQVPGGGFNASITNEILKIRQLPINVAKGILSALKGLF